MTQTSRMAGSHAAQTRSRPTRSEIHEPSPDCQSATGIQYSIRSIAGHVARFVEAGTRSQSKGLGMNFSAVNSERFVTPRQTITADVELPITPRAPVACCGQAHTLGVSRSGGPMGISASDDVTWWRLDQTVVSVGRTCSRPTLPEDQLLANSRDIASPPLRNLQIRFPRHPDSSNSFQVDGVACITVISQSSSILDNRCPSPTIRDSRAHTERPLLKVGKAQERRYRTISW